MPLQRPSESENRSNTLELVQQLGPARLWRTGRLRVIELQGSPRDMGRQHGQLLQADIKQGMVPRVQQRLHPKGMNFLLRGALDLGRGWLYNRILKDIPSELREEMHGMAEGSGQQFDDVLQASYFSEFAQLSLSLIGTQYFRRRAQAAGACTSAVCLSSPVSESNRQHAPLLHGKNQDYEGAGYWDATPTLIICRPDQGYAYAKTTSAGILKGNLSTNEHGISISGHFLFSYKTRKRGQAFTTLENMIMRRARSLDEALEIIRSTPCLGSFAFVISDSNSNQAVCVEIDGTEVCIRQASGDTLAMANNYGASEQQIHNDMLLASCSARNPVARRRRMEHLLEGLNGTTELQDVVDCLSDHFDVCSNSSRALGNVIAQTTTVTSGV
ncbi:MAG: C45 family peptidase, partial [Pseudomonadota bacterium]|nr:C45 family peptidase [Pseudomonadota bacterium]